MNYQDRYDELDNIVGTIRVLVDEIEDEDYIEDLREIMYRAQGELDEVSDLLEAEQEKEEKEMEMQYWKEVF